MFVSKKKMNQMVDEALADGVRRGFAAGEKSALRLVRREVLKAVGDGTSPVDAVEVVNQRLAPQYGIEPITVQISHADEA